jgi:ABC-2 type transport system ATP-binding protein
MSSAESAIRVDDLTVKYGFRTAVTSLSLNVPRGGAVGLLGANGAGKTTTLHAILGFLRPKSGSISLLGQGKAGPKVFHQIGFAPDDGCPPEYLNGREYLNFVGKFRIADKSRRKEEVDQWLSWFELDPRKRVSGYSKGMKRRLGLAQALLGKPDLVILDEPLNGLDPLFILKLREGLEKYIAEGGTLLFSSHILAEVEKVCSEVAILAGGRLVIQSSVAALAAEFGSVENAFKVKVGGVS